MREGPTYRGDALQRGDAVPHFQVKTVQGEVFSYSTIWQSKNLVLVVLPSLESTSIAAYVCQLTARLEQFDEHNAACVMTRDHIPGLPAPGVVVADRWGEVAYVAAARDDGLPVPEDLLEWIEYVQIQCPECQGEAK
jgi:peroxiredoxin